MMIFNRRVYALRRHRAAAAYDGRYDFLKQEACERLADRLTDIRREFAVAADIGCHTGQLARTLKNSEKVGILVQCDHAAAMVSQTEGMRVQCDEECLPFAAQSLDAIFSVLAWHAVNDLPGMLSQARWALKPDGLLLASFFGGDTFRELRHAAAEGEADFTGGAPPRVAPMVDVRDAGNLLQRAGFSLPVADIERLSVAYDDAWAFMRDLQGMGETNILHRMPRTMTPGRRLQKIAEAYQRTFAGPDGRITATFDLMTLTAWAPAASQPKPARRGSGQIPLEHILQQP